MDDYTRKVQEIAARLKDGAPAKPSVAKPMKPRPAPNGPGWLIVPAGKTIEAVALSSDLVPLQFHGEAVCMLQDCPGCDGNAVHLWFFPAFVPARNTLVRAYLYERAELVRGEVVSYRRDTEGQAAYRAGGGPLSVRWVDGFIQIPGEARVASVEHAGKMVSTFQLPMPD